MKLRNRLVIILCALGERMPLVCFMPSDPFDSHTPPRLAFQRSTCTLIYMSLVHTLRSPDTLHAQA